MSQAMLHYASLDGAGGVEFQLTDFVARAAAFGAPSAAIVACGPRIHPLVAARLPSDVRLYFEKYAGPVKLPKWPSTVRRLWQQRLIERTEPDVVVIWNRLRDSVNTLRAAGAARCIYWERGASWFADTTPAKTWFLNNVRAILANSHAARRMLELRWQYQGPICVVPNALRPALKPAHAVARPAPTDRPWRIGVAARLESIKGVAIAIHAVAALIRQGQNVMLEIAGDGPERARLQALSHSLGVSEAVEFHGLVDDMAGFYQRIDVLAHPALREPFGQIAIEANAYGVPAIVTAVDGLVEAVADDVSGITIVPTGTLSFYSALGASTQGLPPFVYHPAEDTIGEPRTITPECLADAIGELMDDPARYTRLSRAGIERVTTQFDFDQHVEHALAAIDRFSSTGVLCPA